MLLSIVLVYKCFYGYFKENGHKKAFYFVAIASTLSFICTVVIGRFYTLEYHAINISLSMLLVYLFVKILYVKKSLIGKGSLLAVILLLYFAISLNHYNYPIRIFGGTLVMVSIMTMFLLYRNCRNNNTIKDYEGISKRNFFSSLLIVFLIILSVQSFFTYFLGTVNIYDTTQRFIVYAASFYKTYFFAGS